MKRPSIHVAAAVAVTSLLTLAAPPLTHAADSTSGGITPPTQSDNQLNNAGSSMQKTDNNAGAATGNGNTLDSTANSASTATKDTSDKLKNSADTAAAGTLTADNPAPDAKDIRKTIGKLTGEAFEKSDLDDLVSYFATADRDRIQKSDTYGQSYGDTLDGRIEQLQNAWKSKYGHEFELKHANKLFGDEFVKIQQAKAGSGSDVETVVKALGGDDADVQAGRAIAIASIVASHGMPELKVPLVHELPDAWKIDVPNDVDAAKLRQDLLDHLTALGDHQADWPADEAEAYRLAAHHVLMAVLNKPVAWQGDASASVDTATK